MSEAKWLPPEQWKTHSRGDGHQACQFCGGEMRDTPLSNGAGRWNHLTCTTSAFVDIMNAGRVTSSQGVQRAMVEHIQAHEGTWVRVRKIPGAKRSVRYEWETIQ